MWFDIRALGATLLFTQVLSVPTNLDDIRELNIRNGPQVPDVRGRDSHKITIENQCQRSANDRDIIEAELYTASQMASYAHDHIKGDLGKAYRKLFIPPVMFDSTLNQLEDIYKRAEKMVRGKAKDVYNLVVTCDDHTDPCRSRSGHYAHMVDGKRTLNLWSAWFDRKDFPLRAAADISKECKDDKGPYKHLEDLWFSKAQAILHAWTHTSFVFDPKKRRHGRENVRSTLQSLDYGYGIQFALDLASGSGVLSADASRNSHGDLLCPNKDNINNDPREPPSFDFCDPALSLANADTLAIMASGLYFSDKSRCDRKIGTELKPLKKEDVHQTSSGASDRGRELDAPVHNEDGTAAKKTGLFGLVIVKPPAGNRK
ncbi:MAG: hypothetical protein Q9160_003101 [Pyrenula sp. 1 TL-2023]